MRILPAFVGALLITVAVFLFMHSLIQRGKEEGIPVVLYHDVQIVHQQQKEPPPPEPEPIPETESTAEPSMQPLAVTQSAVPKPVSAQALDIPALEVSAGNITIAPAGDHWSPPLGGGGGEVIVGGADAQGYVEVVPYDTRRPNVPEVAWQNKIDGWVLVAFSVTPDGRTRDVRVLDASPRGVFEEKVIAAVNDWAYHISFPGEVKGDVVLTQKVEVQWRNYPQNLPNVD